VRNCRQSLAPAIISILLIPTGVAAQSASSDAAAALKHFDAAAYVAWFGGNRGGVGGDTYRDWYSTLLGSAGVGYYWTEHLKTEVELAVTGRENLVSSENQRLDTFATRYVYRDHNYQVRTLSIVQSYQFLHNAWVHPFLGAGLDLDWEERTVDGRVQIIRSSPGGVAGFSSEPLPREARTLLIPRGVVVAGFKGYLVRHGFFRMDLRASLAKGLDQVAWRFGFGWDF
jgi:hypothetical protein